MILIIGFLLCIGFYCILAQVFKTTPFKVSGVIHSVRKKEKSNVFTDFMNNITLTISKYIPLNMIKTIRLTK